VGDLQTPIIMTGKFTRQRKRLTLQYILIPTVFLSSTWNN
jgi:hypothetical protein